MVPFGGPGLVAGRGLIPTRLAVLARAAVLGRILVLTGAAAVSAPQSAVAQYRFGVSAGGASTLALVAEYRWPHQGVELQVGTWGFRDMSVSATAKQYLGSSAIEPFVGAGLWVLTASSEKGRGYGLVGRVPVGFDIWFATRHSASATVYLNRALVLRRPDPEDLRPPRARLIPLPEFAYRRGSRN